jgi:anti-sigma factor RsiW
MKACPKTERLQDYLEGLLSAAEAHDFQAHVQGCASCALELAIYRRLVARLEALPEFEPDPALTEHIFERILPSRERKRRLVRALGIGYAATLAVVAGAGTLWLAQPGSQEILASVSTRLSGVMLQGMVWTLDAFTYALALVVQGRGLLEALGIKFAPLVRVIPAVVFQPTLAALVFAASAACAGLLWWMRPRDAGVRRQRGGGHVAMLGF